jgi:cob(I)alamin adenosyltransferase
LNADLSPLRSFVLPAGTASATALHLARTVCRRAERRMVELAQVPGETVGDPALRYINRLSDFLFVASRFANAAGPGDVLWTPGQNR